MTHATHTESTSSRGASRSRGTTQARNDVLDMLKKDHRQVKDAFREFTKLQGSDSKEDQESRAAIVRQTCLALDAHAELEESLFYPAIKEALDEADLVDEAEVEHQSLKYLIGQLREMKPDDEKFDATFTVLGEYVLHHVKEEEGAMFRKLTRARIDWPQLLDAMQQERDRLLSQQSEGGRHGARGKDMKQ